MKNQEYNIFQPEKTKTDDEIRLEWLKNRAGHFTGSSNENLMSCDRIGAKKDWSDPSKVFNVGSGFFKYVFKVAMERRTGLLDKETKSFNLEYGHENEPLLIENLIEKGHVETHSKCDFMTYKETKIGATPDGLVTVKGKPATLEMKSCVSWDGVHARLKTPIHEKHSDFWQIQTEMLVQGTSFCLYVVAYPMTFEHYHIQEVQASEIHQRRLIQRAELAEQCIKDWSIGVDIEDSVKNTIQNIIEKQNDKA